MKLHPEKSIELSVLVIDDEYIPASRHSMLLKRLGVQTCEFRCDYYAALTTYRELRPEIVLLDIRLDPAGERDGFELLQKMRDISEASSWLDPFCIFITGYHVAEAKTRARNIAGSIVLEKPISDELLVKSFNETLAGLSAWQETVEYLRQNQQTWNDDLERERVSLIHREYKSLKLQKKFDQKLAARLEVLQDAHGRWLRKEAVLDTSKIEKALEETRRLPPSDF